MYGDMVCTVLNTLGMFPKVLFSRPGKWYLWTKS